MTSEDKFQRNIFYRINCNGGHQAISLDLAQLLIDKFGWELGKKSDDKPVNRIFKQSKVNQL